MAKRFKRYLLNYIAMALSGASFIIAVLNLMFFQSDVLRDVVFIIVFLVLGLDFLILFKMNDKEFKENILNYYEIQILRWSYIDMGRYIKDLNIPELNDIELRIENELRDIEIKKGWYAENLGIKNKGDKKW